MPTADKKDSVTQDNEKSTTGQQNNRNTEGDGKIIDEDTYVEEIPTRNSKVALLNCKLCKCIFKRTDSTKEQHLKSQMHVMSLQKLAESECFEEVRALKGNKVLFLSCNICHCSVAPHAKVQHLKTETHTRRSELKRYFDAKKQLEEDKLRDQKSSIKNESAGKEQSEEQQSMKAGVQLSNTAPTQVCNPEAYMKTDKIKVSLPKQPEKTRPVNTSDKINPGPKETKSSGSGDGDVSSSKPADLELRKVFDVVC